MGVGIRWWAVIALSTLVVALCVAAVARAASWSTFGGSTGRSSFALGEAAGPPLAAAWNATSLGDQGVWTSPIVTQGARPLVAYGTQKPAWIAGPTSKGNVHLRDLATGEPIGPVDGVNVDDGLGDADTFGGGNKASVPFVDASTPGGSPGQLFVLHNDDGAGAGSTDSDVAIAQIDEATGDVVQDVAVPGTPHFAPGGATSADQNGSDVSGSPALDLDAAGNGVLVFRVGLPVYDASGAIVSKIENVHVVPLRNARSRSAVIDVANQRITPDFQPTSRTSPTLVTLADPANAGKPTTFIAMGTSEPGSRHYVKTFRLSDLEPGPTSDALVGWGQTVAIPLTPSGLPAGTPGSGVATAPYLIVATGNVSTVDGTSTARVYRLEQQGDRLAVAKSTTLAGYPSPALAVAALVGPRAAGDGKIVVTTEHNLYVLRTSDLSLAATFSTTALRRGCAPCDNNREPPPVGYAGFYTTAALVGGRMIYVARDDGAQLVLDLDTARPVSAAEFTQDPGNAGSTFTRGQPAVAHGHAVFASGNGVFAYHLGEFAPSTPPPPAPPPTPTPTPSAPPPPPPSPPDSPARPRAIMAIRAPARASLRELRRHGLTVRLRLTPHPRSRRTIRLRLYSPAARNGRRHLVAQLRRLVGPTTTSITLRLTGLRRSLRTGRHILEVTVGDGRHRLGPIFRRGLTIAQ